MFGGFDATKLKPQLKMAVGRIEILKGKKSAVLKNAMRQVAVLLSEEPPKEEKARIRAEALIRDDNLIEALEILQLECELVHERIKLIQYSKECPVDLIQVISTIIWASHRVDIPELLLIRKQFKSKYGKQFEENAMRNIGGCLNERVVTKLSVEPPAAYLVQVYLEKICEQFDVEWKSSMKLSVNDMIVPMPAPTGTSVAVAQGTGLGTKYSTDMIQPHTGMSIRDLPTVTGFIIDDNDSSSIPPKAPTGMSTGYTIPPPAPGYGGSGGNAATSPNGMSTLTNDSTAFHMPPPSSSSSPSNARGGGIGGSDVGYHHHQHNNNNHHHHHQQQQYDPRGSDTSGITDLGDYDEPDIFIPGPSAPPGSVVTINKPNNNNNDNNNTNNNDQKPPPPPSNSNNNNTYDDLLSRFSQLKK